MSRQSEQGELFALGEPVRLQIPESQSVVLEQTEIAYEADFISETEEGELLAEINAAPWTGNLKRRVQHYGYRYDYAERTISKNDRIGDLPDWSLPLADRLAADGLFDVRPDQLIVNEYEPGQGIAPHVDRDCFGPVVAAVSLGGDCMLKLHPPETDDDKDALDFVVLRRSMMAYRGKGRHLYRHGIPPRKADTQNGVRIPRDVRVSLTFRTVRH